MFQIIKNNRRWLVLKETLASELFVSLREQGCEEITHIINKAVSENVKTARCVLNLVVEVSVLESKGHDRPRSYAKSSNYLSGFANAMIPISHTTQCPYKSSGTLLYEHQVGASAFRDSDPTTPNYFATAASNP